LEQIACGEFGMSPSQFYALTPRQFYNISVGRRRKEERDFKENWERTRAIVAMSIMPHLKKGASRDVTKVYPLPWDGDKGESFKKEDPKTAAKKALEFWENLDKKEKQN